MRSHPFALSSPPSSPFALSLSPSHPFTLSLSKGPSNGRRCVTRSAATLLMAAAGFALLACTTAVSPLPESEQRAQAIDNSLICPICPGETIDRSQVQLAKDMQVIVREQIAEGRSDDEIRQFFVDRYGERVLAAPPREGFHWLVWGLPPAGIALGLLALYWVTQLMGRRPPQPADGPDADLAPYLLQVDRELADEPISPEPPTRHSRESGNPEERGREPVRPEPVEGRGETDTKGDK